MNGKKIAIVVMAGALIFSLERLIAQRSMVFEVGATPVAGLNPSLETLG